MTQRYFWTALIALLLAQPTYAFTLMLDPAGDARTPGRTIDHHLERGITLQIAEAIKKNLELEYPINDTTYAPEDVHRHILVRTILTRAPGEVIASLHNAMFANRLEADLYISIHCFHLTDAQSPITFYYYLTNPVTDLWATPKQLALYPYDQAHLYQVHRTKTFAERLKDSMIATKGAAVRGVYGLPFKPLVGIKVPAIAIEIGLRSKDEWAHYAQVIAKSLRPLIASQG